MKFILTAEQYSALREAIAPYMTEDSYGKHTICNIYCDSDNDDLIRHSLDKPVYKEKLRLRSYGKASDDSDAYLEIKKKFKGIVYKRRICIPYKQAHDYITYGTPPDMDGQVFSEIDYFVKRLSLKPKIVICYDRRAFFGNEDKEFRITFDSNIRYRREDIDLRNGDYGDALAGQPYRVMEIKVSDAMPLWMVRILTGLKIYRTPFSKYGSIHRGTVGNNIENRGNRQCSQA